MGDQFFRLEEMGVLRHAVSKDERMKKPCYYH